MKYRVLSGIPLSSEGSLEDIAVTGSFEGHWMGKFELTTKAFKQIISNAKKTSTKILIDYDHESFWGGSTRAAGWIDAKKLSISEDGTRLLIEPEWTESGRQAILNKEYAYKSPVIGFSYRDRVSGEVVESAVLHSVALTNTPFLTELSELRINSINHKYLGEDRMEELKKIAEALGVEATVDAIVNSYQGLQAQIKDLESKAKIGEIALGELGCTADNLVAVCMELKNPARNQDQVAALQTRIAELENQGKAREAADAVARVLSDGKLSAPGTELHKWASDFALKDLQGFNLWASNAPKIVPVQPVQPVQSHLGQNGQDIVLSKSLGLTQEDWDNYKDKI